MSILKNKILIVLASIYFVIRLVNLTLLPIFNDEAIYLDWGFKSLHLPNNLFYSLFDAKQPLLIWIFGISQMVFTNPLFAGRFVSVIAGFITLLGIYTLGNEFFNKKISFISCILFIIIPLFSFYDRQALMESIVASIGVWSCYLFLKLFQTQKTYYGKLLGIVLGIGFLVKTNSLFFFFTAVILNTYFFVVVRDKKRFLQIICWLFCLMIAISFIVLSQPGYWDTLSSNDRYSLTLTEMLSVPFYFWFSTAKNIIEIGFWYLTPFCFILGIVGIVFIIKNEDIKKKLIVLWVLIPLCFLIFFARNIQPRYVVSFLPILCIFCSYVIVKISKERKLFSLLLNTITIILPIWLTITQLVNPISFFIQMNIFTNFSQIEEYLYAWPSGYGIIKTKVFIEEQAKKEGKIYIGVRPDSGNPESSMFAYFNASKVIHPTYINIDIIRPWIKNDLCISTNLPMYFVSRDNQLAGLENYIEKELIRFYKPESKSYIGVYKVKTCPKQIKKV